MLYGRVKNQWNDQEDLLYSLYSDWSYDGNQSFNVIINA